MSFVKSHNLATWKIILNLNVIRVIPIQTSKHIYLDLCLHVIQKNYLTDLVEIDSRLYKEYEVINHI